jgi:hypothetical protein
VIEGSGDQKLTDLAQGVTWRIREFKPSLLTAQRPLLLAFVIVPETQVIAWVERRFSDGCNSRTVCPLTKTKIWLESEEARDLISVGLK